MLTTPVNQPTVKGLHHVGLSVKSLEGSIEFYCRAGMRLLRRSEFRGGAMDRITGLTGTSGRSAMLQAGSQYLELFEFATPAPQERDRLERVCEHGITHFCIEVPNLKEAYKQLKAAGTQFHCAPQAFGTMSATYARDPDGNVIELLETGLSSA